MFAFLNTPLFQLLHLTMAGFLDLSPKSIKNLTYLAKTYLTHNKGQIISECPYEIIVYPKIATKKFPRFLPWPLRRDQIKKIKALYYTN